MIKYFLYIRKSTDEDTKQVLSLEAQETELKELAKKEGLCVAGVFREAQTAKCPGRPIFNTMLERIEKGDAEGILAWHPDRLARNSVDGGKIIFLVDSDKIKKLKFPTFWFEPTPQGKFMLNIAFGQSKYFVDNLSENTKRGLRQKLRRGEWPGWAPIGYINDLKTHTITRDPEKFVLVKKLFKLYATEEYSLKGLQKLITSAGLFGKSGKKLSISMIQHTLKNPFYYGIMKYKEELYQASHEPMITKKLFDKCQKVMANKSRPRKQNTTIEHTFRGILNCAECGCAITSEIQRGHIYYRCTKKRVPCSQPYIREEDLVKQVNGIFQKVSLNSDWADKLIAMFEKEEKGKAQSEFSFVQNLKTEIAKNKERLEKLLDTHLDNIIDRKEYIAKNKKSSTKRLRMNKN